LRRLCRRVILALRRINRLDCLRLPPPVVAAFSEAPASASASASAG